MADYVIKRGDFGPAQPLVGTLSDQNGPINLTDALSVQLFMRSETLLIKTGPAEITDAANGKIKYVFEGVEGADPIDTAEAGTYRLEAKITWDDGSVQKVPNEGYLELEITEDLES